MLESRGDFIQHCTDGGAANEMYAKFQVKFCKILEAGGKI
jgi:hypothetical protein